MFNFLLENTGLTLQQFQTEFKTFIVDNRLVGTVAGVTMGITTKDLIASLVGYIIVPFFYLILFQIGIKKNIELLPGKTTFDYINFIRQLITWTISIIAIFFFVYYFFMSVIGIKQDIIYNNTSTTPSPISSSTTTQTSKPIPPPATITSSSSSSIKNNIQPHTVQQPYASVLL